MGEKFLNILLLVILYIYNKKAIKKNKPMCSKNWLIKNVLLKYVGIMSQFQLKNLELHRKILECIVCVFAYLCCVPAYEWVY